MASNWQAFQPSPETPWDLPRVVHLHRRAAFAAPWSRLQQDLADGPQASVKRLLNPAQDNDMESMAETIGDAAMASGNSGRLKAWWFYRMLMSPDPLGERLTLMWHNHFATSNRKVDHLVLMREQNELMRQHARGPFAELLGAVVKHPALLVWLDADSNRKGHPNENLARELMELFTLGVGNYTEDDVKESARALTGWTVVRQAYDFRKQRHDDGLKTVLGTTAKMNGEELLDLLLAHPATSRRVAWRICRTFFGDGVIEDAAIDELARGLRDHDLDIGWAVEVVLRSQLFFADANLRSRVAGPVEYILGTLHALELIDPPPSTLLLAEWSARMGQNLFYPPNVGGWNEGRSWLGSRTVVARANFATAVAGGRLWRPMRTIDIESLLQRHGQSTRPEDAAHWLAQLLWGQSRADAVEHVIRVAEKSDQPFIATVEQMLIRPESQIL